MHDLDITIPLIELGVPPIASHGRTHPDGSHYLRASAQLTGVDFDNSDYPLYWHRRYRSGSGSRRKAGSDYHRAQPPCVSGATGEDCPDGEHRPSAG
ncbi:hypothetical protein LNP25_26765 [Klebsiella variicola subsp. variicola]|nr:hypothetical protein [Klebsiella variicola subsp. variicola]